MEGLDSIVVTDIMDVVIISSPKGRCEKMHNRRSYGLSFCMEGQITYTHNGQKYVSDREHAIILPKGQTYSICGDKKGVFPLINFECINFSSERFIVLPVRNLDSFINDFRQMKDLFLFKNNKTKIMSIFYNIIHKISNTDNIENHILLPAIRYLEENYCNQAITNKLLADKCNISEVYFRKLFKEKYGISPKQFIIDIRINRAKQMMTDGILKIKYVSEECGFSNPYHFCRMFKEKTGVTPREYTKQNKFSRI